MDEHKQVRFLSVVLEQCGITQSELGRNIRTSRKPHGYGRTVISRVCNSSDGFLPENPEFVPAVEKYLLRVPVVSAYIKDRGFALRDIWNTVDSNGRPVRVKGTGARIAAARKLGRQQFIDNLKKMEVAMLSDLAMRHFSIKENPFRDEIRGLEDIYLSEDHRYIHASMLEAAQGGGFLAVVGEVGSGKSVMRQLMEEELRGDKEHAIVSVASIDKGRVTVSSLCDSVILDLSRERPRGTIERKSRQVEEILRARAREGVSASMIIEEAHDLRISSLKALKRFYEITYGFRRTLGIILIGQPELSDMLNESINYDAREVIRRIQVARIGGLDGSLSAYVEHKFGRKGMKADSFIEPKAIDVLARRLVDERKVSHAHPLTVNNLLTHALNEAARYGEKRVTVDIIRGL